MPFEKKVSEGLLAFSDWSLYYIQHKSGRYLKDLVFSIYATLRQPEGIAIWENVPEGLIAFSYWALYYVQHKSERPVKDIVFCIYTS